MKIYLPLFFIIAIFCMGAASCHRLPEDSSAFASEAGHSTIAVGGCGAEFNRGWKECLIQDAEKISLPTLRFVVTNPSDYAVSDCLLGIYKSGSTDKPGLVEIDLSGLIDQLREQKFCILKIETIEHFRDNNDSSQMHSLFMRGGFFIELINQTYLPEPSKEVVAFCTKVYRTDKGRTVVEECTK